MPLYEYDCKACGFVTEKYCKKPKPYPCPACEACGGETKKKMSLPNAIGVTAWKEYTDMGLGIKVSCGQDIEKRLKYLAQPKPYKSRNPWTGKEQTLEIPGQKLHQVSSDRGSSDALVSPDAIDSAFKERAKVISDHREKDKAINAKIPLNHPVKLVT